MKVAKNFNIESKKRRPKQRPPKSNVLSALHKAISMYLELLQSLAAKSVGLVQNKDTVCTSISWSHLSLHVYWSGRPFGRETKNRTFLPRHACFINKDALLSCTCSIQVTLKPLMKVLWDLQNPLVEAHVEVLLKKFSCTQSHPLCILFHLLECVEVQNHKCFSSLKHYMFSCSKSAEI